MSVRHIQVAERGIFFDSACGRKNLVGFALLDRDHAEGCIRNGTLVQPCKRCCRALGIDFDAVAALGPLPPHPDDVKSAE